MAALKASVERSRAARAEKREGGLAQEGQGHQSVLSQTAGASSSSGSTVSGVSPAAFSFFTLRRSEK